MSRPRRTAAQGSALFLTALLAVGTLPWCCLVEHHLHATRGSGMSMAAGVESAPAAHENIPAEWTDGPSVQSVSDSVCPWTHVASEISSPRALVSGVVAEGLLEGEGTPQLATAATLRVRFPSRLSLAPPEVVPDLSVPPPRSV